MGWNVVGVLCGTCIGVHLDGTEHLLARELKRELGKLRADLGLWKNS